MGAFMLFCGTALANIAVTWVQFPVKVIIKSSKLIPAMAISTVIGNSRHFSAVEYLAAGIICAGTACFSYRAGRSNMPAEMVVFGIVMLMIASVADVAALNMQQWMMQRNGVPPMSMMLRQNFACLVGSVILLVASGKMRVALEDAALDCNLFTYSCGVGLAMAVGVWANTNMIYEIGSVAYVVLSTSRKITTVLLSYVFFPKPLLPIH